MVEANNRFNQLYERLEQQKVADDENDNSMHNYPRLVGSVMTGLDQHVEKASNVREWLMKLVKQRGTGQHAQR